MTISRYRILGRLGSRGGSGVVYEAEDAELGRLVAIKLLGSESAESLEALDRFKREALSAAALGHPHICAVYDVGIHEGQPYIVMERMSGQTLREAMAGKPLAIDRVLALGEQIADALDAAHRAGIVHGDLKPAKLFLTQRGEVKLLGFGVARLLPGRSGTPPAGDVRGDLFSLGVVLYEMMTGRLPLEGASTPEQFAAILQDTPAPPSRFNRAVPADLDRIMLESLEKDPRLRYQSAATLRANLRRLRRDGFASGEGLRGEAPPSESALPWARPRLAIFLALAVILGWSALRLMSRASVVASLAVLPLVNAGDPALAALGEGIVEGIINKLSRVPRLKVTARSIAFRFRGRESEPMKVGQELKVDAVLTGRVVPEGDSARIDLELVEVRSGVLLWGERYVVRPASAKAVEEEIARRIIARLGL